MARQGRALLVSHWPVVSDAAVTLTTRMLAAAKTGLTRAEAHRQAMTAMIDTAVPPATHTPPCGRPSLSSVKVELDMRDDCRFLTAESPRNQA